MSVSSIQASSSIQSSIYLDQNISLLEALKNFGISSKDYETNRLKISESFFEGVNLKEKMNSYLNLLKKCESKEEKEILKNLIKEYTFFRLSNYGWDLYFALEEFKDDKEIVLTAINSQGISIKHASERLRYDREVVIAAVINNGLIYIPRKLMGDKEIMSIAVNIDGCDLFHASEELKNDKELVLAAVNKNALAIEHASEELRLDIEISLIAVRKNFNSYYFLSSFLKNNKDIAMVVLEKNANVLDLLSKDLKNDRDVVLVAVKSNWDSFQYASEELKNDKKLSFYLMEENWNILKHMSESLRKDKDVVLFALKKNGEAIRYASDDLKKDEDLAIFALESNINSFPFISSDLTLNKDFILKVIRKNIMVLDFLVEHLMKDKDIILSLSALYSCRIFLNLLLLKEDVIPENSPFLFSRKHKIFQKETSHSISLIQVKKLINGYINLTNERYAFNKEADNYVKCLLFDELVAKKYERHLINQLIKNKSKISSQIIEHLNLEAICLKIFDLTDPKILRIIFHLVKEIISYRNKEIRLFFISKIKLLTKNLLIEFLEKLVTISGGKKKLILPSIILSSLNISLLSQKELYEILKTKIKIFKNKTELLLQSIVFLGIKLKNIEAKIGHKKISEIIKKSITEDDNKIVSIINLITVIAILNPEILINIENFSCLNLLDIVIRELTSNLILKNNEKSKALCFDFFVNLSDPNEVFKFINHIEKKKSNSRKVLKYLCEEDFCKIITEALKDPGILYKKQSDINYLNNPYLVFILKQRKILGDGFSPELLAKKLVEMPLNFTECKKINETLPLSIKSVEITDLKIFIHLCSKIYPYISEHYNDLLVKHYISEKGLISSYNSLSNNHSLNVEYVNKVIRNLLTFNGLKMLDEDSNLVGNRQFKTNIEIANAINKSKTLSIEEKAEFSESLKNSLNFQLLTDLTVEKIKKGKFVTIPVGYKTLKNGHAIILLFINDEFVICNKISCCKPIQRFKYNPANLNLDVLKYLIVNSVANVFSNSLEGLINQYLNLEEILPKILFAKRIDDNECLTPYFKYQKVGNCSKAASMAAVKMGLYLKSIKEGKSPRDADLYAKKVGDEISIVLRKNSVNEAKNLLEVNGIEASLKEKLTKYIQEAERKIVLKIEKLERVKFNRILTSSDLIHINYLHTTPIKMESRRLARSEDHILLLLIARLRHNLGFKWMSNVLDCVHVDFQKCKNIFEQQGGFKKSTEVNALTIMGRDLIIFLYLSAKLDEKLIDNS